MPARRTAIVVGMMAILTIAAVRVLVLRPARTDPAAPADVQPDTADLHTPQNDPQKTDQSLWVDPLESTGPAIPLALEHVDTSGLTDEMTEADALKKLEGLWTWVSQHRENEKGWTRKVQAVRRLALAMVERWPEGKHAGRARSLALLATEPFEPEDGLGDEFWAYAVAEAPRRRQTPEAIALSELRRAKAQKRDEHALIYGQAIQAHAPQSKEAASAKIEMGMLLEHQLARPEQAEAAYLDAAKSPDDTARVGGKKGALFQALTRAEHEKVAELATALLAEPKLDNKDIPMALYYRAFSSVQLKRLDIALSDCQRIQKEFPDSEFAAKAQALEARVRKATGQ